MRTALKPINGSQQARQHRGPLTAGLVQQVIAEFVIDPRGPHGTAHWMRVRQNGLRLAHETHANATVIELFALFHDSKRQDEGTDPDHSKRGADNAERYWRDGAFELSGAEFEQLYKACAGHTWENVEDPDSTVLACWDADRLDLGRVGIVPDPNRLFTVPAKRDETITWAWQRSKRWADRCW